MKKQQEQEIPLGYVRVTDVLKPFSTLNDIDPATLAKAADRGSRVHSYCESYALNLFLTEIDEDCKNYFEVFKIWFDNTVQKVLYAEKRLNSTKYRISGAFDIVAILKGDTTPTLIDIKTPNSPSSSWQLQTAAYQMLIKEVMDINVSRRICLMLPKFSEKTRVVEYENHKKDEELYLKALELHRFFNS